LIFWGCFPGSRHHVGMDVNFDNEDFENEATKVEVGDNFVVI